MTHYGAIWIFAHYFSSNKPGKTELAFVITVGTVLLVILAYIVMVVFDVPVRRYLTRKRDRNIEATAVTIS